MTRLTPQKHTISSEDDSDRDRLSKLPDDLVVRILSCMPIIDAVRTVLLRRFGNLWTLIPTINIDMSEYQKTSTTNQLRWFCYFVRHVLMLHQSLSIDRFHLCVKFYSNAQRDEVAGDIRMWFRFAFGRQAKEIKLYDLSNHHNPTYNTILPRLTSDSLVTLNLDYCRIEGEIQVKLGSLKKLSLNHVSMTNKNFQTFISGCPSLQKLVIMNLFPMKKAFDSITNMDNFRLLITESFDFPNLETLHLQTFLRGLDIINIISSVRDLTCLDPLRSMNNMLFMEKFQGVQVLRLSGYASKLCLHALQKLQKQCLQNRLKRIVLDLYDLCERCFLGIRHLMRSSKYLEELVIYTSEDFEAIIDFQKDKLSSPSVLPQLKTITVHCYGICWKSQLQLIEALLKSATVLDKLVIVPMKHRLKEAEKLEFIKHVSSFPNHILVSFQSFISGCPSLQKLVIVDLLSLTKPIFSVPNIDNSRLVLTMSLNFPNLETLYTYLRSDIRPLDITDISSVHDDIYIKYLTTRDNIKKM
ncbi:putative FBD-associated F-box protein At3g50710 [Silene latifolia]|uniref:putative FBD-associated F-box protein At3g50710 n=1 Tax=Silene latifolia TaxID=37657 RepID=UPI003D784BCB